MLGLLVMGGCTLLVSSYLFVFQHIQNRMQRIMEREWSYPMMIIWLSWIRDMVSIPMMEYINVICNLLMRD